VSTFCVAISKRGGPLLSYAFFSRLRYRGQFALVFWGGLMLLAGCHHAPPSTAVAEPPPPAPALPPTPELPPAPAPAVPPPTAPAAPVDNMEPIDSSARIYYDDATDFTDSLRLTIREQEKWLNVWSRATRRQASVPPIPTIDFRQDMLLLVSAGRMNSGDQIHVDSVGTQGGHPVAIVRITVECHPFPTNSYPLEIVRVPRAEEPVTFVERHAKSGDC